MSDEANPPITSTGRRAASPASRARSRRAFRIVVPCIAVAVFIGVWQLVCTLELVPSFMLPSPVQVVQALIDDADLLAGHAFTTLTEALIGLAGGIALGAVIAIAMERFKTIDAALSPLLTISQTVPVVAIAPLLVLWFGYDMLPKILLVILTTFFPITVALSTGFRSADPDAIDLLRTMGMRRARIFLYAKLPAAADSFFSGLLMSATYAVVAAVVAEWLGGFDGLGVYMTRVRKSYDYDSMFAAIVIISAVSLLLMAGTKALRYACMPWKRNGKRERAEEGEEA